MRRACSTASPAARASPACVASVKREHAATHACGDPGAVKILPLNSSTAYSLNGASGKTRLAWTVIGQLPVVQCVWCQAQREPDHGGQGHADLAQHADPKRRRLLESSSRWPSTTTKLNVNSRER